MGIPSDVEIAQSIILEPIEEIAESIGINKAEIIPYGRHIAKLPTSMINPDNIQKNSLILVTAITPTKAGIGKTTVSVGLALGLNKLQRKVTLALREPSLGPCFGMKGGAAGGGYSQVLPMEAINLHFTGDFHAITSAHNMISALLDNYLYRSQGTEKDLKEIVWKRVLDVNDRSLRYIITGVRGPSNGALQESGFDITPASELMAILCLAENIEDLKRRIGNIILGYFANSAPFTVNDLGIAGAITVLLKDAINPNLVQTTEHTAAILHGGPFANIAHGCNSIIATKMAMSYGQYTITEAGFGADLGAEKFFNIKCRQLGLSPKATVLVVTTQALKTHGGVNPKLLKEENHEGLIKGFANLDKHIANLQGFGQQIIVTLNKYSFDSDAEIKLIKDHCLSLNIKFAINEAFLLGGVGAVDLAQTVLDAIEQTPSDSLTFTYELNDSIEDKLTKIAQKIYGAESIALSTKAKKKITQIVSLNLAHFPICIAKTQYSFSDSPELYGAPKGFKLRISDLIINAGSEMIVAIAGDIMRMPGLPITPQANHIDLVNGKIVGLS